MNILIVEDEISALENLLYILREIDPDINILACTESVTQTVEWLESHSVPDLILMDLHLSDGLAFEIFKRTKVEIPVIFITSFDEYALQAFKVNAIDYLLKPVDAAELKIALDKFSKLTRQDLLKHIGGSTRVDPEVRYPERMLVPVGNKFKLIDISDISFFYTSNKDTTIHLSGNESYGYNKSLDMICHTLNPVLFFRANKQFVIAKKSIKNIVVWPDKRLVVEMDIKVPEHIFISKNKASVFRKWILEE